MGREGTKDRVQRALEAGIPKYLIDSEAAGSRRIRCARRSRHHVMGRSAQRTLRALFPLLASVRHPRLKSALNKRKASQRSVGTSRVDPSAQRHPVQNLVGSAVRTIHFSM
jgi:hypothetical protein